MKAKKKKVVRTIEEFEKAIDEAERNREPLAEVSISYNMTLSEANAKKLFARTWKEGVPQEGSPPFVQPDSPGQKRKH